MITSFYIAFSLQSLYDVQYGSLGDVVHDVLGCHRLPSPRLPTDDSTLQETKHNFKQEFGALTKELSTRMIV